jgi:OOP family OmpA-OmpF porin
MIDNQTVSALLIGYADETGDENKNIQLSENRAKSASDTLVAAGIDANRLSCAGGGEDKSVTKKTRHFCKKSYF